MKIHYANLGMPKTASSWLYLALTQSPEIDYVGDKELDLLILESFDDYRSHYEKFNIGLNFNTGIWRTDSHQINFLNSFATHQSIIFRNPFQFANSLYNFTKAYDRQTDDEFLEPILFYFDYAKILDRLSNKILVLLYDDIVKDPRAVLDRVTNYLDIQKIQNVPAAMHKTQYRKNLIFRDSHVKLLNDNIDKFQYRINTDLSHWKMNV